MTSRCTAAIYARFSTDLQSRASIQDQIRKCREYAERQDWKVLADHTYADEGVSGVGADRPGLNRLLEAVLSRSCPFNAILVDDTSRLSRNLGDTMRIYERLNFAGIRMVSVSQGIDTENPQAEVLVTVHGLVDSLYVKELSKKTHRGLEGLALRGFHTGGRTFGYSNVRTEEGVRLQVNDPEANIVRRIFQMSADGRSLKGIARALNAEGIPPPRPRAGKQSATWCFTAIHAMLRRELYIGRVIWNRSRFVKAPGTNKRLRRARPKNEWRTLETLELRVIEDDLWRRVQERLVWVKQVYGTGHREGLLNRSASSRYLLSGFLKCGVCGANITIVTGRARRGHSRYGCSRNFNYGGQECSNNLKERQDWLENRVLADLQAQVLRPEVVNYAVEEFGRQLKMSLANLSGELAGMRERKRQLESEVQRLTKAVAEGGHSKFLLEAISERERELQGITERLLSTGAGSVDAQVSEIQQFVTERLADLRKLLYGNVELARAELAKHVTEIRMIPHRTEQKGFYVAEGEWNLLGGYPKTGRARHLSGVRARLVAGVGFEPTTFGL